MSNAQSIKIGITHAEPAWEFLLEQIGTDWCYLPSITEESLVTSSLVIVNGKITEPERRLLRTYTSDGGAVLYTPSESNQVKKHSLNQKYISSLFPQQRTEYSFSDIFDLHQKIWTFQDNSLVLTDAIGKGIQSYLSIDISGVVNDQRTIRKSFFADSDRLPNEKVARRSKNALRQFIQSHIEYLHHQRGLPLIHKWFFPNGDRSLFTFRIDSDKGTQKEIEDIYRLSEEYKIPTTWFLDVQNHESWMNYFSKYEHQEIAIHCYRHSIYKSIQLNKENFGTAKDILELHGLRPQGISAPTGEWNRSIGIAIKELGVVYSSEFGYDYDNLPSFPLIDTTFSPVVQLPIHPICVGSLLRAGMSPDDMIGYFMRVIDNKLLFSEPICLYHHPTHKHNEVFREVFKYIMKKNITPISFLEYAHWWILRSNTKLSYTVNGTTLSLNGKTNKNIWIRISMPDKTESIRQAGSIIDLSMISFNTLRTNNFLEKDISRTRIFSIRHIVQDLLDWWIKKTE